MDFAQPHAFGPCPFKFLDVWLEDAACLQVIKQSWVHPVADNGDMSLRWFLKMTRLKKTLKAWNKEHFGNIFDNVKKAEERLAIVQRVLDDNFCTKNVQQVSFAQQDLDLALQREEKFWSQKAHCQWLKEGDKNTAFFPSYCQAALFSFFHPSY